MPIESFSITINNKCGKTIENHNEDNSKESSTSDDDDNELLIKFKNDSKKNEVTNKFVM